MADLLGEISEWLNTEAATIELRLLKGTMHPDQTYDDLRGALGVAVRRPVDAGDEVEGFRERGSVISIEPLGDLLQPRQRLGHRPHLDHRAVDRCGLPDEDGFPGG